MKTVLALLILTFTFLAPQGSFAHEGEETINTQRTQDPYWDQWCRSVGTILRIAINSSLQAPSYEDEREIILRGIERTLEVTPPKNNFYFLTTLASIRDGLANYSQLKDQIFFLRREARYALNDLEYLDRSFRNRGCFFCGEDHRPYVMQIIARGLEEGERVKTDAQEIYALNRAATQSIGLLDDSDYRRKYTCARNELNYLLEAHDILSKREHLRAAWAYLNQQRGCFF